MTSIASRSEDVNGADDVDSHRGDLHRLQRREEQGIEVDVEGIEEGDMDEERRGVLVFGGCRACCGGSAAGASRSRGCKE